MKFYGLSEKLGDILGPKGLTMSDHNQSEPAPQWLPVAFLQTNRAVHNRNLLQFKGTDNQSIGTWKQRQIVSGYKML